MDRALQQRRSHNLLLIERILSLRDDLSPFTLLLDSLQQSAKPLLADIIKRANKQKIRVIYVSFETLKSPAGVDAFIKGRRKAPDVLRQEIGAALSTTAPKALLILDTLHPAAVDPAHQLPTSLFPLISTVKCSVSILATYHVDVPVPHDLLSQSSAYSPSPLTLLSYVATTILTVHSFYQVLAKKRARDRSLAEPVFGLDEEIEGVLMALPSEDAEERRGLVIEMEHRRKSGRPLSEWYHLELDVGSQKAVQAFRPSKNASSSRMILLDDHPLYRPQLKGLESLADNQGTGLEGPTFSLDLSDKERRDREGVILPYFDAQTGEGGVGGRILYDMGAEDDFDEEEDEI
ncbi:hypothetical protein MMC25_005723 [Agyrium rufum]|nr:hypothetical protein [Agyrium rufum]